MKPLMVAILTAAVSLSAAATSNFPNPIKDTKVSGSVPAQTAVLAGGCFWGVEAVFEQLNGVSDVVSGFAGGSQVTAHYTIVSMGTTGHAESVKITFDPARVSY